MPLVSRKWPRRYAPVRSNNCRIALVSVIKCILHHWSLAIPLKIEEQPKAFRRRLGIGGTLGIHTKGKDVHEASTIVYCHLLLHVVGAPAGGRSANGSARGAGHHAGGDRSRQLPSRAVPRP